MSNYFFVFFKLMHVILLQDIHGLGKKYDIKEVKNGYARNFLIPKNLIKLATKKNLKWLENQKEILFKKTEEMIKKTQNLISDINNQKIIIFTKVGSQNQLFESITPQKIIEKLKEKGFKIKKEQISLEKPIKELGEWPVKIKFKHNLEAKIKIIVKEEK